MKSFKLLNDQKFQRCSVGGDTRFDRVTQIAASAEKLSLIEKFCGNHKVIVAGSTWEDDEAVLIHYAKAHPELKFIIAPHETDTSNISDVRNRFSGAILYSELQAKFRDAHILIIDNIGMLSRLYSYAYVTYVGGGFNDNGIHNILEAAVYAKPVLFGPVYQKFREANELIEAGGAFSTKHALELESLFDKLISEQDFYKKSCEAAGRYVMSNRGATEKIIDHIEKNRLLTS